MVARCAEDVKDCWAQKRHEERRRRHTAFAQIDVDWGFFCLMPGEIKCLEYLCLVQSSDSCGLDVVVVDVVVELREAVGGGAAAVRVVVVLRVDSAVEPDAVGWESAEETLVLGSAAELGLGARWWGEIGREGWRVRFVCLWVRWKIEMN